MHTRARGLQALGWGVPRESLGMTVPSTDAGSLLIVLSPFGKFCENSQPGLCWPWGLPTRKSAGVLPCPREDRGLQAPTGTSETLRSRRTPRPPDP